MNKFYLSVLFTLSFHFSFSAPVIKSVTNGYWNQVGSWDLNRLPQVGDSIVIDAGHTIIVNSDVNLNGAAFLKVYGSITFRNNSSTLSFGNNSFIWVLGGGQISGSGSASQKLKLNGVNIFDGSRGTVYGPQAASVASNGFAPMMEASSSLPLPAKFLGFTITRKGKDALIQWATSEEINVARYEVERSNDGNTWSTMASVAAKGNSSSVNDYSYTDKTISSKIVYYRIKEMDIDGRTMFTAIKSLKTDIIASAADITIASVNNKVLLQFPQQISGNIVVRFVSTGGQVAHQQTINNPVGQVVLSSRFTGTYIISISNGQNLNTAKQVVL